MSEIKYTKDHEIILVDGNIITVGITDFAKDALGDLVFIQLPTVGQKVAKGKDFAVVESVKIASEIYTPLSGEVVEVNSAMGDNVDMLKEGLDRGGWIAKLKVDNTAELAELMSEEQYKEFLKTL
jgi:glycine cleavage system H protein